VRLFSSITAHGGGISKNASQQKNHITLRILTVGFPFEGRVITVASGVKLNQTVNYRLHLDRTGDLGITAAGRSWYTTISATWRVKPLYFKAGVYVQD
jgi:hypothetical protein